MRTLIAKFRVGFPFGIATDNGQRTDLSGTRLRYLPVLSCLCFPGWPKRPLAASWPVAPWRLRTRVASPATVPARRVRGR